MAGKLFVPSAKVRLYLPDDVDPSRSEWVRWSAGFNIRLAAVGSENK